MKKLLHKILLAAICFFAFTNACAQEYRDPSSPQQYYYDDFEYTGGSLLNWAFNTTGTPRTLDLKSGSLLNGTYCLGSNNNNNAPYYIGGCCTTIRTSQRAYNKVL